MIDKISTNIVFSLFIGIVLFISSAPYFSYNECFIIFSLNVICIYTGLTVYDILIYFTEKYNIKNKLFDKWKRKEK